jgi:hypothetical protein
MQVKDEECQNAGITIFDKNSTLRPFLHLQLEFSFTCAYNACSALMYYWSMNNERQNDEERISAIKMNISRFIRNEVSGIEIAQCTLTTNKGACLTKVLKHLLNCFGTDNDYQVESVSRYQNKDKMIGSIKKHIEEGRPFVFNIECFPGLCDRKRLKYTGKVDDFYTAKGLTRPKSNDRVYHALVCIGYTPKDGENFPPMLLVQDSCPDRPVFQIGINLFMDLGRHSTPCSLPFEWAFDENADYIVDQEAKVLCGCSPMALDDVPCIIDIEKSVQQVQREDMSRYLDVVNVKPDECVITYT